MSTFQRTLAYSRLKIWIMNSSPIFGGSIVNLPLNCSGWATKLHEYSKITDSQGAHIHSRSVYSQNPKSTVCFEFRVLHSWCTANLLHAFHGQLIGTHFRMFSLIRTARDG